MGFFDWLAGKRARVVDDLGAIGRGRVQITGRVEALSQLVDPVDGHPCVALEYQASPPSLLGAQGTESPYRAFSVEARQAVDFVLTDGTHRVLVRVTERQDDVSAIHRHLADEYGLRLKVAVRRLVVGDTVHVVGRAEEPTTTSAYRSPAFCAALRAERIWADGSEELD